MTVSDCLDFSRWEFVVTLVIVSTRSDSNLFARESCSAMKSVFVWNCGNCNLAFKLGTRGHTVEPEVTQEVARKKWSEALCFSKSMSKIVTIFDSDFQIILDQTTKNMISPRRKPFFARNPISWILKFARLCA